MSTICTDPAEPFKLSGQLFSIHAFIEKDGNLKQLPLLFCLMSHRTTADYVSVFRVIVDRLPEASVEGFVADFETGKFLEFKK